MEQQGTLPTLVEKMRELEAKEKEAEDNGMSLPDEAYYEKEIVGKLLAGKVDQAVELRRAVEERIEALKLASENAQTLLGKIDTCFMDAIRITESKRLDGLGWSARIQNNSRAAVIIEDELKIPAEYKNTVVSIHKKFNAKDLNEMRFWVSMILRRSVSIEDLKNLSEADQAVVSEHVEEVISKTALETQLKKDPQSVPGAKLEKGQHLRFTKGDAKAKMIEKKG